MKTIERFMEEIKASDALKNELAAVLAKKDKTALEAFLKGNGCEASFEEAKQFLREKSAEMQKNGELSEAELEQISGGTAEAFYFGTALITIGCIVC